MWRKDNFFIGMLASLLLTLVSSVAVVYGVAPLFKSLSGAVPANKIILLAFIPALFLMRWYMTGIKCEKSGMGVVTIVFIGIILYFVLLDKADFSIYPF